MAPGDNSGLPLGITATSKFKPLADVQTHGRANCTDCGCDIPYIMGMFMCGPCETAYKFNCALGREETS